MGHVVLLAGSVGYSGAAVLAARAAGRARPGLVSVLTSPDAWLKGKTKTEGSWWPHWREWIRARSGALAAAPATLGSKRYAPLAAAPGTYVFER